MSRRVLLALLGAILWLGGVEVGPNLHLALHDQLAAHVHEGDSTVFAHEGHVHRAPKRPRSDRDLALRLEHGAHSLAHHSVALHAAAPPMLQALPVNVTPTIVVDIAIAAPDSRSLAHPVARGPPQQLARC
jgi:hypothetical protein